MHHARAQAAQEAQARLDAERSARAAALAAAEQSLLGKIAETDRAARGEAAASLAAEAAERGGVAAALKAERAERSALAEAHEALGTEFRNDQVENKKRDGAMNTELNKYIALLNEVAAAVEEEEKEREEDLKELGSTLRQERERELKRLVSEIGETLGQKLDSGEFEEAQAAERKQNAEIRAELNESITRQAEQARTAIRFTHMYWHSRTARNSISRPA